MKNIRYFKLLWKYIKDEKFKLLIYIILVILNYIPGLLAIYLWGYAIEFLTIKDFFNFTLYLGLYEGVYIIFYSLLQIPRGYYYKCLEIHFMKSVSKDLYHKINSLPAIAYEESGVGELVNRLYTDPDKIMDLLSSLINLICRSVVAIIIFIVAFTISYILVLELVLLGIIMGILANYFYPKIKKDQEKIKEKSDEYVRLSTENLNGIREIKALGIRDVIEQKMANILDNMFKSIMDVSAHERWYYAINNLLFFAIQALIFLTCGMFYIKGLISLATFIVMEGYIWRVDDVVESLSEFGTNYNKVVVSLKRIDEIINNRLYKDELFGNIELDEAEGKVTFNNVYFKYREDEKNTLNGLSLYLEPHKKIAIVGRSGNGKTTIFNLLLRYFDSTKGSITIDNIDIKDLTEKSLRNNISIIRQDPFIFHMSIMDNFRLLDEKVSLKRVREACQKAYIDDYIMSLPKKYDTIIGEGGINLSGGQKQRLAIARTLMRDTRIILFDEATSALDNESQEYIKKTIDNLVKDHTIIIIAHRLSTIIDADIIHVIDKGRLSGSGTHNYLLKNNDIYKSLYNMESR